MKRRRPSPDWLEAIHESAHLVAALDLRIAVDSATLDDLHGDDQGGHVVVLIPHWLTPYLRPRNRRRARELHEPRQRRRVEDFLMQGIAGRVAEEILVHGGRVPPFWGGDPDADHSRVCARLLGVRGEGRIRRFVATYRPRTRALLRRHWGAVRTFAHELQRRQHETLIDGREARAMWRKLAGSKNARPSPRRDRSR